MRFQNCNKSQEKKKSYSKPELQDTYSIKNARCPMMPHFHNFKYNYEILVECATEEQEFLQNVIVSEEVLEFHANFVSDTVSHFPNFEESSIMNVDLL